MGLMDEWERDSRYNAILQGLLAQGMPLENALLRIQRMKEEEGPVPPDVIDRAAGVVWSLGKLFILGFLALLAFGFILEATGNGCHC